MAYNEELGEVGIYPVTAKWSHLDPVVVKLVIDGELILTTPEHPFFISGDTWVAAGSLWLGAQVQKADGSYGAVEIIEVVERSQEMYNLTVDEAHTYFVGDEQWLVHNSCFKTVTQSKKAKRQARKLAPQHKRGYDNVMEKLEKGDLRGLNAHPLTGNRKGQWAADLPGTGRGRGGGRIIYRHTKDGNIEVIEIVSGHRY